MVCHILQYMYLFTRIGWKVIDKALGAELILVIVNILLENVLHTCHYNENPNIQTYIFKNTMFRFYF